MRRLPWLALMLSACMAPKYTRPEPAIAEAWPVEVTAPAQEDADGGWRETFSDPQLQALIDTALENNQDLRATALAVEQARVQLRLASSALGPTLGAEGGFSTSRVPAAVSPFGEAYSINQWRVGPTATWELDVFGRLRNERRSAAEATRAAAEDWRTARLALISEVATTALQERTLAEQLRLAEEALALRQEAAELVRVQVDAGLTSDLDRRQAEALVATARASRARLQRARDQSHNALVLLVGQPVEPLGPTSRLSGMVLTRVPAGVPSELLQRRPDIRAAEHRLIAAHADIGAARAAFFPSISLTGGVNVASSSLTSLFDAGTLAWSASAPSVTAPIFGFGANRARLRGSQVGREQAVAVYQGTLQAAFREVADVLVAWDTYDEQVQAQEAVAEAQRARVDLAMSRYESGTSSYLEVLDAERDRFSAEQTLMDVRLERAALAVTWFRVSGGGIEGQAGPWAAE